MQIIDDLRDMSLMNVIYKWRDIFAQDFDFVLAYSNQLYLEKKFLGFHTIYSVSKFSNYCSYFLAHKDLSKKLTLEISKGIIVEPPYNDELHYHSKCSFYLNVELTSKAHTFTKLFYPLPPLRCDYAEIDELYLQYLTFCADFRVPYSNDYTISIAII